MVLARLGLAVVFTAVVSFISSTSAYAIPAFSKKYEIACVSCHDTTPKLNEFGEKFKINGWQMPDSEDGGETAKLSPSQNLFLDIGKANPPISLILEGGITLMQAGNGESGDKNSSFFCCVNGNAVTVDAGGTIAPNIGYWLSLPWGKEDVAQGYLRFVNWFGAGYVNLDIGAMKVVDYDAVGAGREWFGSPLVAFYGHPSLSVGTETGYTAPYNDTGVRVYGRPMMGAFTYEAGMYTGGKMIGAGEDDAERAYTFMGKVDIDKLAVSARYWTNKTGLADTTVTLADGSSVTFPANRFAPDEGMQEIMLAAVYRNPHFVIDLAVDRTSLAIGSRTSGEHTFSQESVTRLGGSIGAIWLINSWLESGLAYGYSAYQDYNQTIDGVTSLVKGAQTSLVQWRIDLHPAANVRVGLELWMDTSSTEARTRADGSTFDAQNKVLLQWEMAL